MSSSDPASRVAVASESSVGALASPASAFVTGETIVVDGGRELI